MRLVSVRLIATRRVPRAIGLLFACCLCLLHAAAMAQSNAQRDEAKQISAQGGKLLQQGKLEDAADAFR